MTPASSLDQPSFTPSSTQTRTRHLVSGLGEDHSPEAIDATFGEGVYQGIKSSQGPYSQWRKIWSRVIEEQEALQPARFAALSALIGTHNTCLAVGLSEREISTALQMHRHNPAKLRLAS